MKYGKVPQIPTGTRQAFSGATQLQNSSLQY